MKLLQALASRRNGNATAGRISSALILGLIAGSNVVVTVVPLGSVVFSGALAPYSIPGTRLVLLGNAIVCLFIAVGALATGLCTLLLGSFKLANF